MIVGIIGAGASGMAAALAASENPDVQVELFERQSRVGKKLSATGNGRCNLTNRNASAEHYYGQSPRFAEHALSVMNADDTVGWFESMGLFTVTEASGKVYPYSDQANSVVDVLRFALERPNVRLRAGFEVQKIRRNDDGFTVESAEERVFCDKLIVACGGLAGTKLGGSMSGYKLLGKLGHKSTKLRPALVQIKSDWSGVAALKGVRANCHVQILHNDAIYAQSTGEIQFTDYGISGPVIFEVSRDVCAAPGNWSAQLDFLPARSVDVIYAELLRRTQTQLPAEELLTGIVHNRLGRVLTKSAGVKNKQYVSELSQQDLESVCRMLKALRITLTEPMGMDHAQVTAGGVITDDFDPKTMESRLVKGLYVCGEVLDIDGDCGGYNLQWAWSSGYLAGISAGKGTV